jgi:hypothetical protein
MWYVRCSKIGKQLNRTWQRPPFGQKLEEQLSMPTLNGLGFFHTYLPAQLTASGTREESATHSNPAVNTPAIDGHTSFSEGALPGEHMSVDSIDQCAVKIKDESAHHFS